MTLYAGPILAAIWTRAFRVQPPGRRRELHAHTVAALGVCLLLCGWRLSTVLLVLLDDKRERATTWDESPLAALHYLLSRPAPNWPEVLPGEFHHVYLDLSCYVGPVVVVLGLASLLFGWRWWHVLSILCAWLAMGSLRWYHPSYWLMEWPFFGSAHSVPRWRIVALLGLGLAAGSVLARWRRSDLRALTSPGFESGRDRGRRLRCARLSAAPAGVQHSSRPCILPGPARCRHRECPRRPGLSLRDERIWRDPGVRADVELSTGRSHASPRPGGSGLSR